MPKPNVQSDRNFPTVNQTLGELLLRTFGPTASYIGPTLANLTSWSIENLHVIAMKVKSRIEQREIRDPKSIPKKQIYMFLSAASQEDDIGLQELWVNLIVNSIDSSKEQNIERHLINLISALDPLDA